MALRIGRTTWLARQLTQLRPINVQLSNTIRTMRESQTRSIRIQNIQPFRPRFNSSVANQTKKVEPKSEGYFKSLTKKYGMNVVYVYLALSLLDFPVCFVIVHSLGQEKIGEFEDEVAKYVGPYTEKAKDFLRQLNFPIPEKHDDDSQVFGVETTDEAGKPAHKASLLTEAAIAYGIHKSFIFIRLPLAVAITPSIVKFGARHFPSWFAKSANKFGVKADGKRRFGGFLF
ncbi:hypothetical protein V1512DRAFT_255744 [Lipomyces arxii]|uniref:uncharacterized protein n=1 Tax=Lipomyces arxii TaxID=56418 RepID=UPI0034CFD150